MIYNNNTLLMIINDLYDLTVMNSHASVWTGNNTTSRSEQQSLREHWCSSVVSRDRSYECSSFDYVIQHCRKQREMFCVIESYECSSFRLHKTWTSRRSDDSTWAAECFRIVIEIYYLTRWHSESKLSGWWCFVLHNRGCWCHAAS